MNVYIILRDTASDFKSEVRIIGVSLNILEALSIYKPQVETARRMAIDMGYTIKESIGDLSFESQDDENPTANHYNVYLVKEDTNDNRPVREKLTDSIASLVSITESRYIPFSSPAPSSTESALKKELNAAINRLQVVLTLHDSLYGKK